MLKKFSTIANIKLGTVEAFKEIGINEGLREEILKKLENY